MMKFACDLCGYVYDETVGLPSKGVAPGTTFSQLSADFECPGCGCEKEAFDPVRTLKGLQTQSHTRIPLRK